MTFSIPSPRRLHAYGSGRVGVLQDHLLTQSDVDKLVAAKNTAELSRVISELRLSSKVDYVSNPHRYINNIEKWLHNELISMVDEDERDVFDILWIKDDAALLAYLLKKAAGYTSAISSEPHVGATAYDPHMLRTLVSGGEAPNAPLRLKMFIRSMREDRSLGPQEIDTKVAQFVADEQLRLSEKSSDSIRIYVAHHIDLQNIRTARRLRKDERPEDHLMKGGEIDISRFTFEPAKLAALIRGSHLGAELAESIQLSQDSSIVLERGLAKAIARDIAEMRSHVLTIDPIFAFGAIAQSQLRLLRTILIGKSAHLDSKELQRLLPPFLSASPYAF